MVAKPFWHRSQRWAIKVGQTHTKDGQGRTDAWFYFLGDKSDLPPADAVTDATINQREWKEIKIHWPEIGPRMAEREPTKNWTLPVWINRKVFEEMKETETDAGVKRALTPP